MNLLIFQNPFEFVQFFMFLKMSLKIFKSEQNVTNFGRFCNKIPFQTQEFSKGLN